MFVHELSLTFHLNSTAPEVVARQKYGLPSDLWSVGVVLLESLIGELTVDRDKAAARLIEEKKE